MNLLRAGLFEDVRRSRRGFIIGSDRLAAAPLSTAGWSATLLGPRTASQGLPGHSAQAGRDGYKEVEAAGYFDKTAADFRQSLWKAGLNCVSTHHALTELKSQLDQFIEYGQALGLEYIICSWAGVHRDPSRTGELNLDDWRYVADQFNRIGAESKRRRNDLRLPQSHRSSSEPKTALSFSTNCSSAPTPSSSASRWIAAGWSRAGTVPSNISASRPSAFPSFTSRI